MKRPPPAPPSNAPDGTIRFGGPVPWFSVTLSIRADDLDPDAVTRRLGVEPDEAWRRGDPNASGWKRRHGQWVLRLRRNQTSEWDVAVAIEMLLDRIPGSVETWKLACANADARVNVGLRLDSRNRGLELPAELTKRLGELGLSLGLDIYAGEGIA